MKALVFIKGGWWCGPHAACVFTVDDIRLWSTMYLFRDMRGDDLYLIHGCVQLPIFGFLDKITFTADQYAWYDYWYGGLQRVAQTDCLGVGHSHISIGRYVLLTYDSRILYYGDYIKPCYCFTIDGRSVVVDTGRGRFRLSPDQVLKFVAMSMALNPTMDNLIY
jgi:hypothetical protein